MKKALIFFVMVLAAGWTIARTALSPQEKYIENIGNYQHLLFAPFFYGEGS